MRVLFLRYPAMKCRAGIFISLAVLIIFGFGFYRYLYSSKTVSIQDDYDQDDVGLESERSPNVNKASVSINEDNKFKHREIGKKVEKKGSFRVISVAEYRGNKGDDLYGSSNVGSRKGHEENYTNEMINRDDGLELDEAIRTRNKVDDVQDVNFDSTADEEKIDVLNHGSSDKYYSDIILSKYSTGITELRQASPVNDTKAPVLEKPVNHELLLLKKKIKLLKEERIKKLLPKSKWKHQYSGYGMRLENKPLPYHLQPDITSHMLNTLRNSRDVIYREGFVANSTFFREAIPKNHLSYKPAVLLLHAAQYTSAVWVNIGTLQVLAESGYRATAVDLPGRGNSENSTIPYSRDDILHYMLTLVTAFDLKEFIVVSPSKSGEYAMPFIMKYPHLVGGFIALAPTNTAQFSRDAYEGLSVPTLVLLGDKDDTMVGWASLDNLEHVNNKRIFVIANATHACYVDNPVSFHQLVLTFLRHLWKRSY